MDIIVPPTGDGQSDPTQSAENGLPPRMLPARFGTCQSCGQRVLMIYRTDADPNGRPVRHECATPPVEHHPKCYQNTGVPDDLPPGLCDCKVLRMLDAESVIPPTSGADGDA